MESSGMSSDMPDELFSFGNHMQNVEDGNLGYDASDARCNVLYEPSPSSESHRTSTEDETNNLQGDFLIPNQPSPPKQQKNNDYELCYGQDTLDESKLEPFNSDGQAGDVSPSTSTCTKDILQAQEDLLICDRNNQSSTDIRFASNTEIAQEHSITELLKELSQESKMLCMQWVQIFDDSEKFENFCPTRLDSILQEAKQLEENLTRQKEMLCHRLKGLSKTLQMM